MSVQIPMCLNIVYCDYYSILNHLALMLIMQFDMAITVAKKASQITTFISSK